MEGPPFFVVKKWMGCVHASIEWDDVKATREMIKAGKAQRVPIRIPLAMVGTQKLLEMATAKPKEK